MKLLLLAAAVIVLAGCATTADVLPTGKNTFMVSTTGAYGRDTQSAAIKIANAFCAGRGQVATIRETQNTGIRGYTITTGTVQFTCSSEEDQGQSVLRPDHGITTVN
jgi:predicted small secreted protein